MTQPPTQPRGSSADIAWLDSRIKELEAEQQEATERWVLADRKATELEAENEALRELLYAEGWGDTSIDKALEAGND